MVMAKECQPPPPIFDQQISQPQANSPRSFFPYVCVCAGLRYRGQATVSDNLSKKNRKIIRDDAAFFISRKTAMLFLGIATFSWLARNALHSESRQAVCIGMSISMSALAVLGIVEFARGFVGMGIFIAVAVEILLGIAYFNIWFSNENA